MHSIPVTEENINFSIAEKFVTQTSRTVFLTGKAGTGKTTFLKHIKEHTKKNTVVVAPTGVAAINAGGTTIHSFFQLPFTPFVPGGNAIVENPEKLVDRYSLLKNLKIEGEKRSLMRELDLLIIDEVSMVRCDILDAIDTILRHFRRKEYLPFGGVQVLLIGDLFQLPPVIPDDQWSILQHYYLSGFFFHARVMQEAPPIYLELKKIYRQTDPVFIDILNRVRNNEVEQKDLALLNERYDPAFKDDNNIGYVTLTTHNHKADKINMARLNLLPGKQYHFEAIVEGDFPERAFPTEKLLPLKEGAQVMFIKNDMERVRRYYNGKIGTIKRIEEEKIIVTFTGEIDELEVEKDTWKNIRYSFNPTLRQVEEEIIGTFTQYAIRLAWAVTIHKSQGLTFQKVIIDAGNSFAPGQVYVALSRCTSLKGIVLSSKIFRLNIITDPRVVQFSRAESTAEGLLPVLAEARQQHVVNVLIDIFDWDKLVSELISWQELLTKKKFRDREIAEGFLIGLTASAKTQQNVSVKFQQQIQQVAKDGNMVFLQERIEAAVLYFNQQLEEEILKPLQNHVEIMQEKPKVKKYLKEVRAFIEFVNAFKGCIQKSVDLLPKSMQTEA